jgi:hypothetical protein
MVRRLLLPLALLLLPLLALAPVASAQGVEQPGAYSVIASTCTIDEHDQPILTIGSTDVTFRTNQVSRRDAGHNLIPSVVRCPVVDTTGTGHPGWNSLIVGYLDPDGGRDQHRVRVRLIQVARPSGVHVVTAFDSRLYPHTGRAEVQGFFREDHPPLDFVRFSYFLEVNLYRGDLTGAPRVWHLRLAEVH